MTESLDATALKGFFFEAALATYAGDGEKIPDEEIAPGFKGHRFVRGEYVYVDKYAVNGIQSFGQTVIWLDEMPVWFMQYHGFCHDKRASELVKKAMREAYMQRQFIGGRGIKHLRVDDLGYGNSGSNLIEKFNGVDWVTHYVDDKEFMTFWHDYGGGLIAKPKCSKCDDTGIIETGNNDLPCDCPAGNTAQFNVARVDHSVAGAELKQHHSDG